MTNTLMTNTLTWNIKPIALPKINSNLLSVISFILLLTMVFLTADVIASHCEEIRRNLEAAIAVEIVAASAARFLFEVWKSALATGNPLVIAAATTALAAATAIAVAAAVAIIYYTAKLLECTEEHEAASGGCDSGGCHTG